MQNPLTNFKSPLVVISSFESERKLIVLVQKAAANVFPYLFILIVLSTCLRDVVLHDLEGGSDALWVPFCLFASVCLICHCSPGYSYSSLHMLTIKALLRSLGEKWRLILIWRIMEIEEGFIRRARGLRSITPFSISIHEFKM